MVLFAFSNAQNGIIKVGKMGVITYGNDRKRNGKNDTIILNTIEELVPQDHDVRMLDNCIDWSFIYPLVENLYSDVGRPSMSPVVLFKMILVNIISE